MAIKLPFIYTIFVLLNYTQTVAEIILKPWSELRKCPNVGSIKVRTSSDNYRMTTIQDGNFTIQALITITEGGDCSQVSRSGLIRTFAMKYALEKFNLEPKYSSYASLGLQVDDVCKQLPTTMARGIEVVSFHRPRSVCRTDFLKCDSGNSFANVNIKEASAIIGTSMSFTTIPLASLMSLYYIPQVSFSSSSRLLSKKDLYKSFFRTIPSDTNQISVMIDIFKTFDWNYVFAIGSDDDYGKLGVSGLKQEASKNDVCISRDEYIPYRSVRTNEKIKQVIENIKAEPKAKVVVLFCYSRDMGDLILKEAEKEGVYRVWLTSESWNPTALSIFNQPHMKSYKNQTHGLLTVSLKRPEMPRLLSWIEKYIKTNYECDMWFTEYVKTKFSCVSPDLGANNTFKCDKNRTVTIQQLMADLAQFPGNTDRLVDAVTSLGYAIHKVIRNMCSDASNCSITSLPTRNITQEMYKTNFTNEQGNEITYDENGDPRFAYYTVENLVFDDAEQKLKYVKVGDWNQKRPESQHLFINKSMIQWPYWFNYSNKATESNDYIPADFPSSRCSDKCTPGQYVVIKNQCCWACQQCIHNNYTNKEMSEQCYSCGEYHYTDDNINCIKTPVIWLKINDAAGLSIMVISVVGLLSAITTTSFIICNWKFVTIHEKSAPLMGFVCALMLLTFLYGPLHVLKPTNFLCQVRNSYFFVLLMLYCAFVLVKTEAMMDYLQSYAKRLFKGNMVVCQFVFLFLFFLLEMVSIAAWLYFDGDQVEEFRGDSPVVKLIEMQCKVDFTAARLVSTFIPCIILIIATFCAFRERNADHSFYEPKFLSFSCIALCIIIVAFLPTFNYVYGIYKAIVWAFTVDVFGFTFMACLILPKIYVGAVRKRKGMSQYPMKPGATKKDKEDKKEEKKNRNKNEKKKKKKEKEENDLSSFRTRSTVAEDIDGGNSSIESSSDLKEAGNNNNKNFHGYTNETFEAGDEFDNGQMNGEVKKDRHHIVDGDDVIIDGDEVIGDNDSFQSDERPPDYQTSIQEKSRYENTIC